MTATDTLIAASDLAQTLGGIAFWAALLAAYVTLFGMTLAAVLKAQLPPRSRKSWIWLVVLAPGIGIILWHFSGRPTVGNHA
jgi:hypothetical protein